jgi:hypothetical protein
MSPPDRNRRISSAGELASGSLRSARGPEERGPEPACLAVLETDAEPAAALEQIAQRLGELAADGLLSVTLPYDPAALAAELAERGHRASTERSGRASFVLDVAGPGAPEVLDLRELEAPEPLERLLEASARLVPGASLLARTPRFPRMLLPQLERRALDWEVCEEPAGSGLVHVRRPV